MKIEELIDKGDHSAQGVRAVLNILLEAPYFYKTDDERLFLVLMRYKKARDIKRYVELEFVGPSRLSGNRRRPIHDAAGAGVKT